MKSTVPDWREKPYFHCGIADQALIEKLRKAYPEDRYVIDVWGPYDGAFEFYKYRVRQKKN